MCIDKLIDISKMVCIDRASGRHLSTADKIYLGKSVAVVIEEAKTIDLKEVEQLRKAIEILRQGECNEIQNIIGDKRIVAGVAHASRSISKHVKVLSVRKTKNIKIILANCNEDLCKNIEKIERTIGT